MPTMRLMPQPNPTGTESPPTTVTDSLVHTAECAAQHFAPWMIEEKWFRAAVEAVKSGALRPVAIEDDEDDDEPPKREPYTTINGMAVIPMAGPLMKKASKFGGTSTVFTRAAIRSAVQDENVQSILLHIDSPGGTVAGTSDLADDVHAANKIKPVYAHIEDLGASAAYWVASQARRVTTNPTGQVGSIGTLLILDDTSGAYAAKGIKVHCISTGKYKGAGFDGVPVTDDHLAAFQEEVDDLNEHFLKGVARGRGMSLADVRELADGRVHIAAKAKDKGLIDEVSSLDSVFSFIAAEQKAAAKTTSQSAPNDSPRGEPEPVASVQELSPMAEPSPVTVPVAQPTAATTQAPAVTPTPETPVQHITRLNTETLKATHEQGRKSGYEEGWKAAVTHFRNLRAACPGKTDVAADGFESGLSVDGAKAIHNRELARDAEEKARQEKNDQEIARLNSLLAIGGHAGVYSMPTNDFGEETGLDPKTQAEAEWDRNPAVRKGFSNKANYVNVRIAELKGTFRNFARQPAGV